MTAATPALTQLCPPSGSRMAVVGGCGGIGRAVVTAAMAAGLSVAVLDLAASMERHPVPQGAHAIAMDARSEDSVKVAFAKVDSLWGGLDCLVNLCGFRVDLTPVDRMSAAMWDEGIAGNLRAAYLVSHFALPLLKKSQTATIVHVSSGMGTNGRAGYGPYAAAKGGINTLAKTLAQENAPAIRVNVVSPSYVETAFGHGGTGRSDENQPVAVDLGTYVKNIPMGRVAAADDIVGPILFLAGPASGYVTGQILHVNGGAFMP